MVDQLFTQLTLAMDKGFYLALFASFSWGLLSILLSPCHLSSIPLIIGYVSSQGQVRLKRSFYLSVLFAVGILITIAAIGLITASMGRLMGDVGIGGNVFVAAVFIFVGLYLMDIIQWNWNISIGSNHRDGMLGAFLLGLIFGVGLGPCTFAFLAPVLGIVFHTAHENVAESIMLILAFGLGNILIITIAGTLTNMVQKYLNWTSASKSTLYVKRLAGLLVILGGFYFIYTII